MAKEIGLNVLTEQGKLALMLFFAECSMSNEADDLDINFEEKKGGETFTCDIHGNIATTYPCGLFLTLLIDKESYGYDIMQKYKPYFGNFIEDDDKDDEEDYAQYIFRLTGNLNSLTALTIK